MERASWERGTIRNLLKAGFPVNIYTRTKSKADASFRKDASGLNHRPSPQRRRRHFIVGYPKDVEEVYLGDNGILKGKKAARSSTATSSRLLPKKFYHKPSLGIDASMRPSLAVTSARKWDLAIMVGGDEDAFKAMNAVFSAMGRP